MIKIIKLILSQILALCILTLCINANAEGYGQPTIGENKVYASDFATFQYLIQNSPTGTRVCVDPELPEGTVWNANYSIYPANGVTVDGSTAPPGFKINIKADPNIGAVTMFVLTKGDNAILCLEIEGVDVLDNNGNIMQTAGVFARTGTNYLIQHLTITNVNDDAIGVGHPGVSPIVKNVSILDNRLINNAKNILLSGQRPDQYGASKVSIGRNYMEGSSDRSPNNAGYQEVQFYNNIVINCGWGAFAQVTVEGSQSPTMLAESNVFINNPNGNLRAWKTTNGNITADAYVNTDDGQGAFGNRNTGGDPINVDTPVPSNIPMSPSATTKMPVADVEAYVTANAGACNGDIDNEISPPTGCPTEVVTDGNISIEEPLPAGGSYWLSSSPFWSCTQNGNNFDKTPYVSAANPYAFTLVGLPAGEYCCNFEGTPMDANGNQLATLYNQCCFTVVSSQANEIIDSGCPVTEISVGTSVNLLLGQTGVPANASNITYSANVSPGSSGNVNVAGNNYNFTPQQQGNYSITVERCYDTGTPSTDLRTRLLASPNRTGYGGNATGGTNYVYVKNFQELNAALQVDDNYVVIDPSLANTAMGFPTEVYVNANNITLDGSEAPGFSMYPDYAAGYPPNLPMMNNFSIGGNKIFHNLKFDGRRIFPYQNSGNSFNVGALFFRKGKDIWVDHVEITGFWDDAILLGMPQSNSADYITLSWLKIHNTDKGVTFYNSAAINEGDGHLSIFNSEFNAAGRNPKNGGGEFVHQWNNYYHDWAWAADMAGAGSTSNSTGKIAPARTYSENNFYENGEDGAAQYSNTNSSSTAHPGIYYDNGGSQFSDVQYQTTGNHQIVSSAPWSIPYSYQVIPANQIKSKVLEGAGATVNYSQNGGVTTICQTEFCEFTVTGENPDNSATIYEAEAATLVGVTKANSNYTGISNGEYVTGFDNDGDKIIFNNINAPSSGTYSLTIRYACSSYKENYVSVNGGGNQNIAFSPSSTFTNKTMNINLNEGNNSISIEKHWGWFDLDYIKIDVIGNPEPPQPNTTLRFEAENGMPVGVNNESDPSASNGEYVTGFDGDEDKITVTAQVENAGMYQLKIGYRSTSGDKKNDLYLNGMFLGNIQFLQSNTFTEMTLDDFYFDTGSNTNTLEFIKSWGWMDVDYFELVAAQNQNGSTTNNICDRTIEIGDNTTGNYYRAGVINSDAVIPANNSVEFICTQEINLKQDFTVEKGAEFLTTIGSCE